MKPKHSKSLGYILIGATLFLTSVPASQAGTGKSEATSKKDEQAIRNARKQIEALQTLDRLEQRHGNQFMIEEVKTGLWMRFQRELSLAPSCQAYTDGDICMVAGWTGLFRGGYCRLAGSPEAKVNNLPLIQTLNCGSTDKIACNPDIFGKVKSPILAGEVTDSDRIAPVCVSKKESRMTLTCLRESLSAAGVEIPAPARSDIKKFNPDALSPEDLKKWAAFMDFEQGGTSAAGALDAVRELCMNLLRGKKSVGIGVDVQRTAEEVAALYRTDPARNADFKDCSRILKVARLSQPQPATPKTTDAAVKPDSTAPSSSEAPAKSQDSGTTGETAH